MDTIDVAQFRSLRPGPRLVITGAVHGNEVCGTAAIRNTIAAFTDRSRTLDRGTLTLVPVCNPVAYANRTREGDGNLNRDFGPRVHADTVEERIANQLAPILADHDVLVDLHSFAAPGQPFVFVGPADNDGELEPFARQREESALALAVGPDRLVYGWLAAYAKGAVRRDGGSIRYGIGTTEFMRSRGGYAVTVECGRHDDPEAPNRATLAIDNALALLGMESGRVKSLPDPDRTIERVELTDVHDRLHPDDRFEQAWRSFDRLSAGQPIAHRADGTVITAPEDGYVVFPNADTPVGREWFYFARRGDRPFPSAAGRGQTTGVGR